MINPVVSRNLSMGKCRLKIYIGLVWITCLEIQSLYGAFIQKTENVFSKLNCMAF